MTMLQGFKGDGRGRDTISVALSNEAPSSLLPMVGSWVVIKVEGLEKSLMTSRSTFPVRKRQLFWKFRD
ncbi:unnamed protein product [Sphagnum tenellum]|jgi:hypothetical protein